jgi:hypothetical protein
MPAATLLRLHFISYEKQVPNIENAIASNGLDVRARQQMCTETAAWVRFVSVPQGRPWVLLTLDEPFS